MIRNGVLLLIASLAWPAGALAYGEPEDGYPVMDELWVEVLTSSCRQDPVAWGWPSYAPVGALWHHRGLNEVARIHSADMAAQDYFDHDSIDGTSWSARISAYYAGGFIGENIAAGYWAPYDVVDGWLHSDGHRENIYTAGYTEIGIGVAHGGSYGIYWTQDFGGGAPADLHPVPAAAASHDGAETTVWAILHAPGQQPEVFAAIGDDCVPMEVIFGGEGEGTYEAIAPAAASTPWTVQVRLDDGSEAVFPDTGAWDADAYHADGETADCLHPGAGGVDDDDDDGPGSGPGSGDGGGCSASDSPFSGQPGGGATGFAAMGLLLFGRRLRRD